ncbi:MAG TPA: SDR family NAD(P)-dependent oxidoreductase [Acidimicrobiia bacterium]|nr:SDR family NAD(P)-dependent oxidoreductase [Acidimicrobiia bacterium]
MRLEGKVAIVTGAGQGIGLAYAERFLAEGARVTVAEIDPDRGAAALAHLGDGKDVQLVLTDITDEASAANCVEETVGRFGTVDILVNNAALYHDIDNADSSYPYLKTVFDVNLHGQWVMTRAAAPVMVAQRWGRVINQASVAAYLYDAPVRDEFEEVKAFAYGQTKWGVVGLTKFLAGQLGQYNVTVNCIAPGVVNTAATRKVIPGKIQERLAKGSAMKRALEPEDLTGVAVFFASDDSRMVTGQVLCVDGGLCMPA